VVLFGAFTYFALFLFTKSNVEKGEPLPPDKQARNWIYLVCGAGMVAALAWAAIAALSRKPIFWPEALALELFAVSWLVKGRADRTLVAAGQRTLYYGRRPRELVSKVRSVLRGE
jgi:hypothetical protein